MRTFVVSLLIVVALLVARAAGQQPAPVGSQLKQQNNAWPIETKGVFSGLAIIVSVTSLTISISQRRREHIETVIEGLRGDRRAVTYAAHTIRLAHLLKRNDYRQSLIASLLLAWNFETSDRARAAVLAVLVDAKRNYPDEYLQAVEDLGNRFADYEQAVPTGDMNRGKTRLDDVKTAVDRASSVHANRRLSSKSAAQDDTARRSAG